MTPWPLVLHRRLFLEQDSQQVTSKRSTQVASKEFSEGAEFSEDGFAHFTADGTDNSGTDGFGGLLAGIGSFLRLTFFFFGFSFRDFLRFFLCNGLLFGFQLFSFFLSFGFQFL